MQGTRQIIILFCFCRFNCFIQRLLALVRLVGFTALPRHRVISFLLINSSSPHQSANTGDGIRSPWPLPAHDGRRRCGRMGPCHRMCSQESVIALLLISRLTPLFTTIWRGCQADWPGGGIRLTGYERCQAQEENPGGKWPFCRSCLSALRPHSVVLAGGLRC